MNEKRLNLLIGKDYSTKFYLCKNSRNLKTNAEYFRFLINKDFDELNKNEASGHKKNHELDEIKHLIQQQFDSIKSIPTKNDSSDNSNFNLILNVVYKILSLQIEPFPDGDSRSDYDEQRIGEEKALTIIRENIKEFI